MAEVCLLFDGPLTETTKLYCDARSLYIARELGADAVSQAQADQELSDTIAHDMSGSAWDDYLQLTSGDSLEATGGSLLASYEKAGLVFDNDAVREVGRIAGYKLLGIAQDRVTLDCMTLATNSYFTTLRLERDEAKRPILSKSIKFLGENPKETETERPDYFVMNDALNAIHTLSQRLLRRL